MDVLAHKFENYSPPAGLLAGGDLIIALDLEPVIINPPNDSTTGGTMKKKTTEEFITDAEKVHGVGTYDYSEVIYKGSKTPVIIKCHEHGTFPQTPGCHLHGGGCKICGKRRQGGCRVTKDDFITRSNKVHDFKFDYSMVDFKDTKIKVTIVCPEHREFKQTPSKHMAGQQCPKCAHVKGGMRGRIGREGFIHRSNIIHDDFYDYSLVGDNFLSHDKVDIKCPSHGMFPQQVNCHLQGQGCPICGIEKVTENQTDTKDDFIEKAKLIHGGRYNFDKVNYVSSKTKVTVVCDLHGDFEIKPNGLLCGQGCPTCGNRIPPSTEGFIKRAQSVHGVGRYDYSETECTGSGNKVSIICPTHKKFEQTIYHHLNGHGCPACAGVNSKEEMELTEFIISLGFNTERKRFTENGVSREGDIVIESKKLIIEYNGLFWHSSYNHSSSTYHRDKRRLFEKLGYRSIMVWSDEWLNGREKVEDYLRAQLNLFDREVGGRKADLQKIDHHAASEFFADNHLQGGRILKDDHYGLFDANDVLVACASFANRNNKHELIRFAQKRGVRVAGGLGRLIRHWRINNPSDVLVSFCDLDKFSGNGYSALGFTVPESNNLTLAHWFTVGGKNRENRQKYMKHNLPKLFGPVDMTKTAEEICKENGVYSVYGSGTRKYELHP